MRFLTQRIRAAASILIRGSVAPFDRVGVSVSGPDRLSEPYRCSVWVHAAIRHISTPIAAVTLEHSSPSPGGRSVRRRSPGADTVITDPRLAEFWTSPAIGIDGLGEFIHALVGWRKLAGEAFILLGDDALVPFPEVRQLAPVIVARPDRMRHIVRGTELLGWEYTDGAGRRHSLVPKQVIHLRQWNPYDDFRGLGEFAVARIAAEGDYDASRFTRNLAASQGDQGVYVIAKNGVVEEAQRQQITAQLLEKRRMQQQGRFRPVFLTGDITVEDPKIRGVDASFLDSRRMAAGEIFVAFGVPPSMAKEQASYSIGSASDYFRLISDTCMPEAARLGEAASRISTVLMGRPVSSSWCWDEHPCMQEVRRERMESADKLWAKGVPLRIVSDYLDLDLPRFPGDDQGWLPVSVVPAASAASMSLDPGPEGDPGAGPASAPADPAATDPVQAALAVLRVPRFRAPTADHALWQRHMRLRQPAVRAYEVAFTRVLAEARAETLRKIEARYRPSAASGASGAESAPVMPPATQGPVLGAAARCGGHSGDGVSVRSGAIDLLFDLGEFVATLKAAFRKVGTKVLEWAGKQLFEELGKDDPFQYPPAAAIQFLVGRENRLAGVGQEVFDSLKAQIQEGMNAGEGIKELSDRVRAACNDMGRGRAKRIAMTETAAAYGTARQEGMRQAGVAYKRWLNSGGDNVRPAHMEANNQTVPADEAFTVGGEHLMFPGDPSGRPDNVINCHCVAVAVSQPDEGLNTDAPANA